MRKLSLKAFNRLTVATLAAALLAACGGGDGGGTTSYSSSTSSLSSNRIDNTGYVATPTSRSAYQSFSGTAVTLQTPTLSSINASALSSVNKTSSNTSLDFSNKTAVNAVATTIDYNLKNSNLYNPWFPSTSDATTLTSSKRINVDNVDRINVMGLAAIWTDQNRWAPYLSIHTPSSATTGNTPVSLTTFNSAIQGTTTFLASRKENNSNVSKIDGYGVNVGIVDAGWQNNDTSYTNLFKNTVIFDNLGKQVNDTSHHTHKVAAIINSFIDGAASSAQLYVRALDPTKIYESLIDIYKQNKDIKLVNLSGGYDWFKGDTSRVRTTDEVYLKAVDYNALKSQLKTAKSAGFDALFVQAIGNYFHLSEFIKKYYNEEKDKNDIYWGQAVTEEHHEAKVVNDPELGDNFIEVTGVYYDPKNIYPYLKKQIIEKFKQGEQSVLFTEEMLQKATQEHDAAVEKAKKQNSSYQEESPYLNIYPFIGSWKCGAAQYSCLAASYYYTVGTLVNRATSNSTGAITLNIQTIGGTSFSAPQVTAIGALVSQNFPWMNAAELKTTLLTTATDIGEPGVDPVFGWGLVNAERAIKGPAQFYAHDFDADMSRISTNGVYYFNNSISGNFGLKVNGKNNDWLVLTGRNNSYKGDTIVSSGNLLVEYVANSTGTLDSQVAKNQYPTLTDTEITNINKKLGSNYVVLNSNVYVNKPSNGKQAAFYANNAYLNSVYNNSYVELGNVILSGDFVARKGSLTALSVSTSTDIANAKVKNLNIENQASLLLRAPSSWTNSYNEYISRDGKLYPLISATNITGNFASIYSDSALYDTKVTTGVDSKTNNKLLVAKVFSRDIYTASNFTRSADNTADYLTLNDGTKVLARVFDQAEIDYKELSLANSSNTGTVSASLRASEDASDKVETTTVNLETTEALNTAIALQRTLTKDELAKLVYSQSATSYANVQRAGYLQARQANDGYEQVLGNRFADSDNRIHAYVAYNRGGSDWSVDRSLLTGNLNSNSVSVGAYGQFGPQHQRVNAGVFANINSSNYTENLKLTDATQQIGKGKVKSYGLSALVGLANEDINYNFFASYNAYDYELATNTHASNYAYGKFKAKSFDLGASINRLVYNQNNLKALVGAKGVVGLYKQNKFVETISDSNFKYLALNAKNKNSFTFAASVYGQLSYLTQLNRGMAVLWYAGADLTLLNSNNFGLNLVEDISTSKGFSQNFLAQLNAGAKLRVSDKFSISLGADYKKANQYTEKNVRLALDVAF